MYVDETFSKFANVCDILKFTTRCPKGAIK